MEGSDSIDGVGADNGEERKPDLLRVALLDERHSLDLLAVTWVHTFESLEVEVVDQIDELKVSGQQSADEVNRPLLESLWQHSVVGVGEGGAHDSPSFLEGELLLIDQDSQQFNCGDGRVSVVELDSVLLSEGSKSVVVPLLVSADHVVDGGRREEVLLL